jgi:hypothetical protein
MYSASDKTKLVDIQTTVEITIKKHAEFGGMVKTYKFSADGARSLRLVLLKGTTTRNAPS